jgi:hypothetical protein
VTATEPLKGFARLTAAVPPLSTRGRILTTATLTVLCFGLIINSSWTATPDSALYLSLGESIARAEGYVFNGEPHTFVPPGYPLMLAAASRILGPSFLSYRVLMAMTGLLTAVLGYLFVLRLCGKDVAFLVGGLFAVNNVLLSNATFMLSDVPFALFVLMALHAVLSAATAPRRGIWIVVAGLAVGMLPIVRINGIGVPPVAAFCLFCSWTHAKPAKRWAGILVFLALACAPALVWQWWKSSFPVSGAEGTYFDAVATRRIWDQVTIVVTTFLGYFEEASYALTGVFLRTGFLEAVAPVVVVVGMVVAFRDGDRLLVPLTVVQFCGLLLSSPGSRYVLFLIPALYLFLGLGIVTIAERFVRGRNAKQQAGRILAWCFAVLAVLNLGHDAITVAHARTALESNGAETARSLPFFTASRWLKSNVPDAVVLTTQSRIIHYLSGCRTIALVRSGFPEHEVWVERKDQIQAVMTQHHPEFLFTDSNTADLYAQVTRALEDLGMKLEEIPEAGSPPRFRLFRIVTPPSAGP